MNTGSGSWECPCCRISGYLVDYEVYRSNCNRWKAQSAIDEAVAVFTRQEHEREQERVRQTEAQAEAIAAAHDLSGPARRLFRSIFLSPAITRTRLQRTAHLSRSRFRAGLRELRTRGLIRREYLRSTARRKRKLLFPST
jgi:hypothetical protein